MAENEPIVTEQEITKPNPNDFLSEKVNQLTGQIETLTGLVGQLATRQQESKNEDEPVYESDPDIGKVVDTKIKSLEDKIEKQRKADIWNTRTDTEFPEIVQKGEFYRMVVTEYQNSENKTSPDAVYNAACRVYARTGRGKGSPDTRTFSANNARMAGATPIIGGGPSQGDELTPEEKYLAAKMEVSEERFKKLRRKQ